MKIAVCDDDPRDIEKISRCMVRLADDESYLPGANGQKGYNPLHLNALFSLKHHIYLDTVIQKRKHIFKKKDGIS